MRMLSVFETRRVHTSGSVEKARHPQFQIGEQDVIVQMGEVSSRTLSGRLKHNASTLSGSKPGTHSFRRLEQDVRGLGRRKHKMRVLSEV
jgi:hypothetical protein